MIAGFFLKKVSAAGVKVSLAIGLIFYFTTTFILDTGIHFVHLWGIMFLLMILTMYVVSYFHPNKESFSIEDVHAVDLKEWKYAKVVAIAIAIVTISVYVWLGHSS